MRHWKQRYSFDANLIFTRTMKLGICGVPVVHAGDPVTPEMKSILGRNRLKLWWETKRIELANFDGDISRVVSVLMATEDRQIQIIINALDGLAEQIIKSVVLDVVANLVKAPQEGGTPVKTGWARANWIPRIGGATMEAAGDPEAVGSAKAAQQVGLGSVLSYKLVSGPVYISNNVPYILRLNEGSSQQAPAGFVQRAVQLAVTEQLVAKFQS